MNLLIKKTIYKIICLMGGLKGMEERRGEERRGEERRGEERRGGEEGRRGEERR